MHFLSCLALLGLSAFALTGCGKDSQPAASAKANASSEEAAQTSAPAAVESTPKPHFDIDAVEVTFSGWDAKVPRTGNNDRSIIAHGGYLYAAPTSKSPLIAFKIEEGAAGAVSATFAHAFELNTRLGSGGLSVGPAGSVLFNAVGDVHQIRGAEVLASSQPGRWHEISYDIESNFGLGTTGQKLESFSVTENGVESEVWAGWNADSLPEDWRLERFDELLVDGDRVLLTGRLEGSRDTVLICVSREGEPLFRGPAQIKKVKNVVRYGDHYLLFSVNRRDLHILNLDGELLSSEKIPTPMKPEYKKPALASELCSTEVGVFVMSQAWLKDDSRQIVLHKVTGLDL